MSKGIVGIKALMDMSVHATGEVNLITAAETLSPTDQRSLATAATQNYIITLPDPAACAPNSIFTVEFVLTDTGGYVTVTNGTLNDKLEATGEISAWINCNGIVWRNLAYSPTMQT
jgi:hypothetical protein